MSFKTDVITSIDQMPNKASYLDIQYNLYVLNKIKLGEDSLKSNGGVSHIEAGKRLKKWLTK